MSKIDFKTCKLWSGSNYVAIKTEENFHILFKQFNKNDFAQFKDEIDGEDKYGWVNRKGEQIGGLHDWTDDFENDFARFRDKINGENKWGWVNRKGEQIGGLHDETYDFENGFARFNDDGKWGYSNRKQKKALLCLEIIRVIIGLILQENL